MFDGNKLTKLMKDRKLTNAKLAEMVNEYGVEIKEDSFKAYRQGRANPRMEVFDAIARVLDVPEQELFENSEEQKIRIAKNELRDHISRYQDILKGSSVGDENITSVAIIPPNADIEDIRNISDLDRVCVDGRVMPHSVMHKIDEHTTAIRATGNAMSPNINDGDILLLDMVDGRDFIETDGTYYVRYGDRMQFKRVQFLGNNQVNLISSNSDYPTINPSQNNIDWEILGKPIAKFAVEEYSKLEIK